MNNKKYLFFTLAFSILLGLVPTAIFFIRLGHYPYIPPEITDDKLYYLSRIREVTSGNIFIGNSYLLEHAQDTSMAFFVADWFYSIPFLIFKLFKLSLSFSIIFSEVFWVSVTGLLLFKLFEVLDINNKKAVWSTLFTLLSVLFFVLRPVSMAVVYPVFIYFLISYFLWLKKPEGKKEISNLVLSSVLSFYVYTYLWQVAVVLLGLTFIVNVYRKKNLTPILKIVSSSIFLSLPVFYYTYKQITNPYYLETIKRVGLVSTHLIGLEAIIYGFGLFSVILISFLLWKKDKILHDVFIFFGLTASSILIVCISNIITGKDLELAVHVGRFADLFIPIFIFYLVCFAFEKQFMRSSVFIFFVILSSYFVINIKQTFTYAFSSVSFETQEYAPVINEIKSLNKNTVVFSDDSLSYLIPVMTNNYVLFSPNAELNIVSDKEIQERYLVSRIFMDITKDQFKADLRKYVGVGNAVHRVNVINRKVKICRFFGVNCGQTVNPVSLIGEKYFDDMYEHYLVIKNNPQKYLHLYHVKYIVLDRLKNKWSISELNLKKLVSMDRFDIYILD